MRYLNIPAQNCQLRIHGIAYSPFLKTSHNLRPLHVDVHSFLPIEQCRCLQQYTPHLSAAEQRRGLEYARDNFFRGS